MRREQRGLILIGLIAGMGLVGGMGWVAVTTHAQAPPAIISISPLTFEITVNPGESITNVVKISNLGDDPVSIRVEAQDFTAAGEAGEVIVREELSETYSLAKWIKIEPETFDLGGHSQKLVTFVISVPPEGEPGGHYGTILASISGGGAPGGAMVVQKVGALLLVQVTGKIKELIWIKSFEAPRFSEYGPIQFTTRFENQGTIHLKPRGFISITNWFGKQVANLPLEQKNILPNSIRQMNTVWDGKWLFGRYTATLAAIYGSSNEPLSRIVSFWVIPWKIVSAIGVTILALGIFMYRTQKRWKMAIKVLVRGEETRH